MLVCAAVAFLPARWCLVQHLRPQRRARRAESQLRLLEAQVAELKARLAQAAPAACRRPMPERTPRRGGLIVALDTPDPARAARAGRARWRRIAGC